MPPHTRRPHVPRSQFALAVTALALVAGCANRVDDDANTDEGPLARSFRLASLSTGVPREVLLGVGYVESRWQTDDGRLVDDDEHSRGGAGSGAFLGHALFHRGQTGVRPGAEAADEVDHLIEAARSQHARGDARAPAGGALQHDGFPRGMSARVPRDAERDVPRAADMRRAPFGVAPHVDERDAVVLE